MQRFKLILSSPVIAHCSIWYYCQIKVFDKKYYWKINYFTVNSSFIYANVVRNHSHQRTFSAQSPHPPFILVTFILFTPFITREADCSGKSPRHITFITTPLFNTTAYHSCHTVNKYYLSLLTTLWTLTFLLLTHWPYHSGMQISSNAYSFVF